MNDETRTKIERPRKVSEKKAAKKASLPAVEVAKLKHLPCSCGETRCIENGPEHFYPQRDADGKLCSAPLQDLAA